MTGDDEARRGRFEQCVLPHMAAAYSFAKWLIRDPALAEDAVQEAFLRAYRYFEGFHGGDARPWLLGIVRNACYGLIDREGRHGATDPFDERSHGEDALAAAAGPIVRLPVDPERAAIARAEHETVRRALLELPAEFREAVVLRELHGCTYREIAEVADVPIGTVMSRLARGRRLLRRALGEALQEESRRKKGTG